jgi:hypothetical protein
LSGGSEIDRIKQIKSVFVAEVKEILPDVDFSKGLFSEGNLRSDGMPSER